MFDLPKGITVEEEIDVSEGVIQPFTHGVISTWIGKGRLLLATELFAQEE